MTLSDFLVFGCLLKMGTDLNGPETVSISEEFIQTKNFHKW